MNECVLIYFIGKWFATIGYYVVPSVVACLDRVGTP